VPLRELRVVVGLAQHPGAHIQPGLTQQRGHLIGLAVVLILLTALQRRPWAIWVNLGVQLVLLAGFAVYPGVGFIGVLFTCVWALIAYFRAEVRRRQGSSVHQQPSD